jgi:hypothetical protein
MAAAIFIICFSLRRDWATRKDVARSVTLIEARAIAYGLTTNMLRPRLMKQVIRKSVDGSAVRSKRTTEQTFCQSSRMSA